VIRLCPEEDDMNQARRQRTLGGSARFATTIVLAATLTTPAAANDVVIDELVDCSHETSCADVYQIKCPQPSRYLCANVENTATHGASEEHFFQLGVIGSAPAAFVGVGGMTTIPPEEDHAVCLTKPMTSGETALKGVVTVTRTFGGATLLNGPDTYRLTAFCVSDENGANKTIATLLQDQ